MTLPRPVLIALLGLALCAAAFLATRSAQDTGSAVTSSPPVAAQKQPSPKAGNGKQQLGAKPNKPGHTAASGHKPAAAKPAKPAAATPAKPEAAAAAKPDAVAKPDTAAKPAAPTSEVQKVLPVIKALGRGDVVVFFFTRPGAADDTGAAEAVKSLKGKKGVTVVKAGFGDLEAYRPVLSGAGVSQIPAIVIVRAGQDARLIEGYVDAATLRQNVADARR